MKPLWSRPTVSSKPLSTRQGSEEEEKERVREELAALERDSRELTVLAVERRDLTPVSNDDAVPLELVDEVVRHRLAQVGAAMKESDERAAAGKPDRRLAGGVAAADDGDAPKSLRRAGLSGAPAG